MPVFVGVDRPTVRLRRVYAGRPPDHHYRTTVRDIWRLCLSVAGALDAARGEKRAEAYVECPSYKRGADLDLLNGRSCALAMALASLGHTEGFAPARTVVATGDLPASGEGTVGPVFRINEKLAAAAAAEPDAMFLFPASQLPGAATAGMPCVEPRLYERLRDALGDRLVPVADLGAASVAVFGPFDALADVGRLRQRVERLRYMPDRPDDYLRAASALYARALALPDRSHVQIVVRYHALSSATFALHALAQRDAPRAEWPPRDDPAIPQHDTPPALLRALNRKLEEDFRPVLGQVPPELRAARDNFAAQAESRSGDFEAAVRSATRGIQLLEFAHDSERAKDIVVGEYRKIVSTRGQFEGRLGLRCYGAGLDLAARTHLDAAVRDVGNAWNNAQTEGVPRENDWARVACYWAVALVSRGLLHPPPDSGRRPGFAEAERQLLVVLGDVGRAAPTGARPAQDPTWAMVALYRLWRAEEAWVRIVEHWTHARHWTDARQDSAADLETNLRHPGRLPLPSHGQIARLLLQAGLHTGARSLVELGGGYPRTLPAMTDGGTRRLERLEQLPSAWLASWAADSGLIDVAPPLDAVFPVAETAAVDGIGERFVRETIDRMARAWSRREWGPGEEASRALQLWAGEPVPRTPPSPPMSAGSHADVDAVSRVTIDKGRTVDFDALPPRSIALDGYVRGPRLDPASQRYSFDHHEGCVRHVTSATCEQVLDALRVGFQPDGHGIFINDLDEDTIIAAWLLLRPSAAHNARVVEAVRWAGRLDALGPAEGGPGLTAELRGALSPWLDASDRLSSLDVGAWRTILAACLRRLDEWHRWGTTGRAGAAADPPDFELLHDGGAWRMVRGSGRAVLAELYRRGTRAAVLARPLPDGTWAYQIAKKSELVGGFDVPRVLAALRAHEAAAHPGQSEAHSWGGGSTIGGSPRNPDGSSSRLPPEAVARVVQAVLREDER